MRIRFDKFTQLTTNERYSRYIENFSLDDPMKTLGFMLNLFN